MSLVNIHQTTAQMMHIVMLIAKGVSLDIEDCVITVMKIGTRGRMMLMVMVIRMNLPWWIRLLNCSCLLSGLLIVLVFH